MSKRKTKIGIQSDITIRQNKQILMNFAKTIFSGSYVIRAKSMLPSSISALKILLQVAKIAPGIYITINNGAILLTSSTGHTSGRDIPLIMSIQKRFV
jgi:hypothetical protein